MLRPAHHSNFNPRTHEGCDDYAGYDFDRIEISIPAPTKGATTSRPAGGSVSENFNPRTHEGCDGGTCRQDDRLERFQSPHPRRVRRFYQSGAVRGESNISIPAPTKGATRYQHTAHTPYGYFNPRTHEGCDTDSRAKSFLNGYFNPRTHEGCDMPVFTQTG